MNKFRALKKLRQMPNIKFGKAIFLAHMVISCAYADNVLVATESTERMPNIVADFRLYHEQIKEIISEFSVFMGVEGLRIDEQGKGAKGTIILNNRLEKMWLLDSGMELFHEVPIHINYSEKSSQVNIDRRSEGERFSEYIASFIQLKPCEGMVPERVIDSDDISPDIQVWICSSEGIIVEKQWFNVNHGVVTKSESFDGLVATLSNIRMLSEADGQFVPPSHYRSVEVEEIVLISQPLTKYSEKNPLPIDPLSPSVL